MMLVDPKGVLGAACAHPARIVSGCHGWHGGSLCNNAFYVLSQAHGLSEEARRNIVQALLAAHCFPLARGHSSSHALFRHLTGWSENPSRSNLPNKTWPNLDADTLDRELNANTRHSEGSG